MTITAGVLCSDGLIVCADSEIDVGDAKRERQKVYGHEDWLLVTGAGWFDYLEMAFDKLCERLRSQKPDDCFSARKIVEQVISSVYEKNIARYFSVSDPNAPNFEMIVAVRCADGELALIKSQYTSVIRCKANPVAVGTGAPLFEYWGRYFFSKPVPMDVASYVSLFILREVKQSAVGCGGAIEVYRLPKDTSRHISFKTFFSEAHLMARFPESAVEIILECMQGKDPMKSLGYWGQQLEHLAQEFRNEAFKEEGATRVTQELSKLREKEGTDNPS